MNPHISHITYTVNDIFNYLDSMNECNLLVYDFDIAFLNLGSNPRMVDTMLLVRLESRESCFNILTV